jgi:hypothetical protein
MGIDFFLYILSQAGTKSSHMEDGLNESTGGHET